MSQTPEHRCDERCVCPVHQTPLLYSPSHNDHGCLDAACVHGHGGIDSLSSWAPSWLADPALEYAPQITEPVRPRQKVCTMCWFDEHKLCHGDGCPCCRDDAEAHPEQNGSTNMTTTPETSASAVTHIAGVDVTINSQLRQLCAWCGTALADYDLTGIAVMEGEDPRPATWPVGSLVTVDGNVKWVTPHNDGSPLPEGTCVRSTEPVEAQS